jgi:transcriptional regulator with XRE-family HTH domain
MKRFSELQSKTQAESTGKQEELLRGLALNELRAARLLTQQQLAEVLRVNQAGISKLERRTDMYLNTLRHFIEARGGTLELYATFPEGSVVIDRFAEREAKKSGEQAS